MPLRYEIDEKRQLVITTVWDTITAVEALEQKLQLGSDARFRPDFSQLIDLTRMTSVDIDFTTVTELAAYYIFTSKSRRAFLVGSNKLSYGMSRMFIVLSRVTGAEQMRVFTDRDAALQWLVAAPFD